MTQISKKDAKAYLRAHANKPKRGFTYVVWREEGITKGVAVVPDRADSFAAEVHGQVFVQHWFPEYLTPEQVASREGAQQ